MNPVQHVCGTKGHQWTAPRNGILPMGNGEEVASPGRGGGTGREIYGTNSLWGPTFPGHTLKVPGVIYSGRGLQLAGGGHQPTSR